MRYIGLNPNNYVDVGDKYENDVYYGYYNDTPTSQTAYREYSTMEQCNKSSTYNKKCTKIHSKDDPILWRIIGIMNNIDDGSGQKESRIKLIRGEIINGTDMLISWDSVTSNINVGQGINDWEQADLMKVLNPGYESESIGGSLYWNKQSGKCFAGNNNLTKNCDFTIYGLNEELKNMIAPAVWNLGSNGLEVADNKNSKEYYELERSENSGKICNSGTYCQGNAEHNTTWIGQVGLMYPSDYGYATSGGLTLDRETCLNSSLYKWSNVSGCRENNWIYDIYSRLWTLMPMAASSGVSGVFVVDSYGNISRENAASNNSVLPVVYLTKNVKIISGDGSQDSPFVISL